ncbi:MAG: ABC transporter permease [Spirochaetes bacterium]|nr:MAG: ABC transporter permease [Spirochaetota bacterium]
MGRYIFERLVSILVTLFIIITLTFFLMHAVPGGPFATEKKLPPEVEKALMKKYHLDDPVWKQYLDYLGGVIRLDFGPSFKYKGLSVNDLIIRGFPASGKIGLFSILSILIIGIPLGIISALKQNKWEDTAVRFVATLGITVPSFIIATVLLYFFALKLNWFPSFGIDNFKGYILPVIALSGYSISFVARLTRSSLLEIFRQDYMTMARAKGLSEWKILFKHGLKNAMIPIITVLGPLIAGLLTGSFVIERIFAIPGMGKHFVNAISNRDYTTIMGITIFYALFLLMMIFIVDLTYGFLDPRIKLGKKSR